MWKRCGDGRVETEPARAGGGGAQGGCGDQGSEQKVQASDDGDVGMHIL